MADTTLKAIIDRFQVVCEGAALSLTATRDAFSHDRQPNALLTNTYWIEDGGLQSSVELTSNKEARIDRLTVWIARKLAFTPQTAKETMETTVNTLERQIASDGLSNSYHARLGARRITRPAGSDILIASAEFTVDYDFDKAV